MNNRNTLKKEVEKILFELNQENIIVSNPKDDYIKPNYTVNIFFDENDLKKISAMVEKLRKIDNRQLFYNPDQLHVTLLGQIDINSDKDKLIKTVQNFIDKNLISFSLFGVGSSKKVSSITAYPKNWEIFQIRKELRQIGGGTCFDGPYENLAWINFMRFLEKPKKGLLDMIKNNINTDFGMVTPKSILLLENSSRMLVGAKVEHKFKI